MKLKYSKNGRVNPNLSVEEKFNLRIQKNGDCIVWTGAKTISGYGHFMLEGKYVYSHRYSYQKQFGEIPEGMVVRHKCDNPSCVNPKHLIIGTQFDNIQDAVKRKRNPTGENHNFNKFKESIIIDIRKLYKTGKYTQKQLSEQFNMSIANVNWIVRNKIWKRLT